MQGCFVCKWHPAVACLNPQSSKYLESVMPAESCDSFEQAHICDRCGQPIFFQGKAHKSSTIEKGRMETVVYCTPCVKKMCDKYGKKLEFSSMTPAIPLRTKMSERGNHED